MEIEFLKIKFIEKNVEDISVRLVYVLGWLIDIMFLFFSLKFSNFNLIFVNIVIFFKIYNNVYVNEVVNSVIECGLSNIFVVLMLEDGRIMNI